MQYMQIYYQQPYIATQDKIELTRVEERKLSDRKVSS